MAADDNGMQDWAADYNGEGRERGANNNGIQHKRRRRRCFFDEGHMVQFFVVNSTICCFWQKLLSEFFGVGVLLTKEKAVHTTLCTVLLT
jgi:hypothetical protein